MSDAYTVGITLALSNGVSEGVASISRDLGALNIMLDDSTTGLKRLGQFAENLKIAPPPRTAFTDTTKAPARVPGDAKIRSTTREIATDPTQTDADPQQSQSSARYSEVDRFRSSPSQSQVPRRATIASAAASVSPSTTYSPSSPFASAGSASDGSNRSPVTPATMLDKVQTLITRPKTRIADLPIWPARASKVDADGPGIAPVDIGLGAWSGLSSSGRIAEPAPVVYSQCPSVSKSSLSSRLQPGADIAPSGECPGGKSSAAAFSSFPSAVPPAPDARNTAMQGDVYLDSTRLGKWVVDHLTKSIERPRAGTTGFDPTLSATWPGASIST
jgi:hypothetical protein